MTWNTGRFSVQFSGNRVETLTGGNFSRDLGVLPCSQESLWLLEFSKGWKDALKGLRSSSHQQRLTMSVNLAESTSLYYDSADIVHKLFSNFQACG